MSIVFNNIAIIGLGYIGLPTAAMLASKAIHVRGVDINENIITTINSGKVHIVEHGLEDIVHDAVKSEYLQASKFPESADAFIITVPTPFKENYEPDLSFVTAAVDSIAPVLKKGDLIILESTSPVGTTEQISYQLAKLRDDLVFPHQSEKCDIHIAYCPERVMPGRVIRELIENDRIIGGMTAQCSMKAKALYQLFVIGECITTTCRLAEMTKLTENAFRDVNIAFANELSMICDKLNINVWELIKLANHHPRVNILQPGPGVGGHCIAVDPWFIVNAANEEAKLIRAAREVNDRKEHFVTTKIKNAAQDFSKPVIACLGITYKADTDDIRESPTINILRQLALEADYDFLIVEPNVSQLPHVFSQNKKFKLVSIETALASANIVVLMVNHKEFHELITKFSHPKTVLNFASAKQFLKSTSHKIKEEPLIPA